MKIVRYGILVLYLIAVIWWRAKGGGLWLIALLGLVFVLPIFLIFREGEKKEQEKKEQSQMRKDVIDYAIRNVDKYERIKIPEPRIDYEEYIRQARIEFEQQEREYQDRMKKTRFAEVESMGGLEFEYWCAMFLRKIGFDDVKVTRASGDHGADIEASLDGEKYVVQCKRYKNPVGFSAVKEVFTAKAIYEADRALIMTSSTFTEQAKADAGKLGVELWDKHRLMEMENESEETTIGIMESSGLLPLQNRRGEEEESL